MDVKTIVPELCEYTDEQEWFEFKVNRFEPQALGEYVSAIRYMENKRRTDIDQTVDYYEKNAGAFIESTIDADVSELYRSFEEFLAPGCRILDLGCGSGRDSKYYSERQK